MAKINYDFYDGQDIYNDESAEADLLKFYKRDEFVDNNRDDIFYLTTEIRSNIINWYPFSKNDEVLEVGCGCGTITGNLCDMCGNVTSIEGSKRRAEITFERHKERTNLEIFAGNFKNIKIDKKFDYVVLIGVFEYAKWFYDDENPFETFLCQLKKYMKNTGKILVAIENRYGIKYWAGANEDHLNKPYIGFTDYNNTDIQTFGMGEIKNNFSKIGLDNIKFFYPFPDYKLPSIIYSDERLPEKNELKNLPIYTYGNKVNFNIRKSISGILDNKMFGFFSNSFLIEAGTKESILSDIVYARVLSYRSNKYKTITVQKEDKHLEKRSLNELTNNHITEMMDIYNKTIENNFPICGMSQSCKNSIEIKYIDGKNICDVLLELLENNKIDKIRDELNNFIQFLDSLSIYGKIERNISEIVSIYNEPTKILKLGLMDLNVSNIIKKDDKYFLIDQEWISDYQIPLEYSIYCSITHIYNTIYDLEKHLNQIEILNQYNIDLEKINAFTIMSSEYFDKNDVIDKNIKNKIDALNYYEIGSNLIEKKLVENANIYFDYGTGYSEENKIVVPYKVDNSNYTVEFVIPDSVKKLRFDPCECGEKPIYYENLLLNRDKPTYKEFNIEKINERNIFIDKNPYFEIEFFERNVKIEINMFEINSDDLVVEIKKLKNNCC